MDLKQSQQPKVPLTAAVFCYLSVQMDGGTSCCCLLQTEAAVKHERSSELLKNSIKYKLKQLVDQQKINR